MQPDTTLPKTPKILTYKGLIRQLESSSDDPEIIEFPTNTITGTWTRPGTGTYNLQTNITLTDLTKVYIPNSTTLDGNSTLMIPFFDDNSVTGYMSIYYSINSNQLRYRINIVDPTGTLTDLYDLIGSSWAAIPTIEIHN